MSMDENPSPTKLYVNLFLIALSKESATEFLVNGANPLPRSKIRPELPIPTFGHFRNHLKTMAGLDPFKNCQTPASGTINAVFKDESGDEQVDRNFIVHVEFDDASANKSVRLRMEHVSTERGPMGLTR